MKLNRTILPVFLLAFAGLLCPAGELKLDKDQLEARYHAKVERDSRGIKLYSDTAEWDAGLRINPPKGELFDFSGAKYLAVDVENLSKDRQLRLTMHISSGKHSGQSSSHVDLPLREVNTGIGLNPGEKRTMRLYLPHASLFTAPDGGKNIRRPLDTSKINSIEFKMQWPFEPHKVAGLIDCRLSNLRLEGEPEVERKVTGMGDDYFPFIDEYGQYKHLDWPEKIHSDKDLKENHKKELAELEKTPAPATWDRFGGWADGPKYEATGSFYPVKHDGKWYLVDPDGNLFWSLGIDVLQAHTDATQGKGHERWFTHKVPADGSLPFTHWNLQKKYGRTDYEKEFYDVMVKRLNAWGINTIGNWSKTDVMILGRKPYTMQLSDFARGFPRFRKSNVKFYDVFDPEFEEKMGNILRDRAEVDEITRKSINDPMCIGYFIDNELRFNDIMKAVFGAEPDQPAKQAFIADLKEKYGTIEKLNKAWGTDFADWEKLAENRSMPKGRGYRADSDAFYAKFVDRYFRICREGIKKTAPHRLYLGCRFVGFRQSKAAQDAAAKYCDVVSVNTYQNSVANVDPKSFGEKPILIGEFHFGTYDRGMFSDGLCPTADQTERATAFLRYVQGALVHPNMVGVHWFQFRDQPLTGRWDGEGYQIGFVDVADTPYPELIKAAREAGENMYTYRKNGKLVNAMK